MINYTKISDKLLQNTQLKLTSRVIYARLAYRMNLSVHNDKAYFDPRGHFYYVIYQIKDLMHDCGLGRHAVINALNQLVKFGLVIKHKAKHFTRVKHLELPKFHFDIPVSHKMEPAKRTKINKINNKSDSKSDRRLKGVENRWNHTNIPKTDPKLDQQNAAKAIKFRRIPKPVIRHIQTVLNGKKLTRCIRVILQARKSVFKDCKRLNTYNNINLLKSALDFDFNDYYTFDHSRGFTKYIDHGLRKAWHDSKPGKLWHYFMKVCKTYYGYAVRWFYQNRNNQVTNCNGPRIPIFKI